MIAQYKTLDQVESMEFNHRNQIIIFEYFAKNFKL